MSEVQRRASAPSGPGRRSLLTAAATAAGAAALPLAGAGSARAALTPATTRAAVSAPVAEATLQPYASYWFPESFPEGREPDPGAVWRSLKDWRPQDDPDLPYNTATVPLAERFTPTPPNGTARAGQGGVSALVSFAGTARNPAQGSPTADYYALTQWAYLDELVFWGGSSGEGIILAPNAPVVDAAHRHGVPVLGNVFLPPVAYGGDLTWTRELVQRDALGRFPIADKLIQVARTYGFDGWFLNGETSGGDPELGQRFADFVAALRRGAPDLRITWYDAFTIDGDVAWQGALNDRNAAFFHRDGVRQADTVFLDFRWQADSRRLASSAAHARRLGRSGHELWAGLNVEPGGWHTRVDWDALMPDGEDHVVSYGLYRPEWTLHSLPHATRTPAEFHERDDRFWSGADTDPAAPEGPGDWRPAARHVADRSTVTALPFATAFNTGHGTAWYAAGRRTGDREWNHLGLQDVLPARRWPQRTDGERAHVAFDFADAWHGGSSLLVSGGLTCPVLLELFRTRLPADPGTVVELAHRADGGSAPVEVHLAVADAEPRRPGRWPAYRMLRAGTVSDADGWTVSAFRLNGLRGIRALGVRLTAQGSGHASGQADGVRWRLGMLSVRHGTPDVPAAPERARVTDRRLRAPGTAELRLTWRPGRGSPARRHEVHQVLPDGERRFLGATGGTALHLPEVRRSGDEARTALEIRAVGTSYLPSPPVRVLHDW
ncbi:endo-beta-N-acetylglucosaminidase [Streptomyces sp. JJ38]|uniref:endo-beta-N-acetylglucosaminidase n=1 Tax=Streptomyces sp. JJ38 TaxID=2738128 RepID=UPI001C5A364F|nr:endo-beta-N-acetylglucosaminidase [Streptomyces sp. JJ38]MBW1595489.1 endo-beta-N-acetylglucosaminidase [Streptomyces sp. JJ38]